MCVCVCVLDSSGQGLHGAGKTDVLVIVRVPLPDLASKVLRRLSVLLSLSTQLPYFLAVLYEEFNSKYNTTRSCLGCVL